LKIECVKSYLIKHQYIYLFSPYLFFVCLLFPIHFGWFGGFFSIMFLFVWSFFSRMIYLSLSSGLRIRFNLYFQKGEESQFLNLTHVSQYSLHIEIPKQASICMTSFLHIIIKDTFCFIKSPFVMLSPFSLS